LQNAREILNRGIAGGIHTNAIFRRLGRIEFDLGNLESAYDAFEKSLSIDPTDVICRSSLAEIARLLTGYEHGLAIMEAAIRVSPDKPVSYCAVADYCKRSENLDAIEKYLNAGLTKWPMYHSLQARLAALREAQGRYSDSIRILTKLLKTGYDTEGSLFNAMGNALSHGGRPGEASEFYKKSTNFKNEKGASNYLFNLNYLDTVDDAFLYREHKNFATIFQGTATNNSNRTIAGGKDRITLAYISGDFKRHSVAHFIEPIIKGHDKKKFRVICYSNCAQSDYYTDLIKNSADAWRNIVGVGESTLHSMIESDDVDIAIDLSGHTNLARTEAFARRLAPIQVTYIGYPCTTGLKNMDYRLVDAVTDPPGLTENWHSEKLVRLKGGFLCYSPIEAVPEVRFEPPEGRGIVFGSFNNLTKYSDTTLDMWARILKAVENSRLVIKARQFVDHGVKHHFVERFRKLGVDDERLTLIDYIPDTTSHLEVYNQVDIGLDTFPYNGTTTTFEALHMGVPVITLTGRRHASRVGASILKHISLDELICESQADYVDLAIRLAQDTQHLVEIKSTLRERLETSPLMDRNRIVSEVEKAYEQMLEEHARTK